ncbi:unnamed protein product [Leptosia nina]|uniref:Carboxylic ester hydrolase n=1 Tax=Leptosia nina TaxID=320188 RepID=A0AAV1JDM1_9NEOP
MKVIIILCVVVISSAHHSHDHENAHDHGHGHQDHNHHGDDDGIDQQPVVRTRSGKFLGGYNITRKGRRFETYRGIRYAEPPIGELRFQPPRLIKKYLDPVDASEDGPACPLPADPNYPVDEDCLTVNVYTPLRSDRKKLLPVIFFIHPGGFYAFTGRSDVAGPHYLLDKDVVLVTINYRLGSLGFLSTGDELAPGNNGFKDMVAALKWVQRNIKPFGGDPDLVTVAGCSAGSISAMLMMVSPMSTGLFKRAISMSGSPIGKVPLASDQRYLAVRQAELFKCPTDSNKAMIDCLKTKPWRQFGDSLYGFYEFGFDPVGIWTAVMEPDFGQERFLTIQPDVAIREKKIYAVPHLISQTQDEFFWMAYTVLRNDTLREQMNREWERIAPISFLLPRENTAVPTQRLRKEYLDDRPLKNDERSGHDLGRLYVDSVESLPVYRMAKLMTLHSPQPVYEYEWGYIGNHSHYEDPVTKKPTGAAHHDELIYLFSLPYRFPAIGTEGQDAKLVDRMTAIWYNFARYGDPNPKGDTPELGDLKWPKMTPNDKTYLRIDNGFSLRKDLFEDKVRVWDELYPMQY